MSQSADRRIAPSGQIRTAPVSHDHRHSRADATEPTSLGANAAAQSIHLPVSAAVTAQAEPEEDAGWIDRPPPPYHSLRSRYIALCRPAFSDLLASRAGEGMRSSDCARQLNMSQWSTRTHCTISCRGSAAMLAMLTYCDNHSTYLVRCPSLTALDHHHEITLLAYQGITIT